MANLNNLRQCLEDMSATFSTLGSVAKDADNKSVYESYERYIKHRIEPAQSYVDHLCKGVGSLEDAHGKN
jgi:hypothetical protein